jgi:ketosteroid isomerase-like protein
MSFDPSGDAWEIRQLVERYASAVDRVDGETAAALFAEDGVFEIWLDPAATEPTHTRRGPAEITAAVNHLTNYDATQHVIANSVADVDGDTAVGETQCAAHHLKDGKDSVLFITYTDRFVRIEDQWRFAHRQLRTRWGVVSPVEAT